MTGAEGEGKFAQSRRRRVEETRSSRILKSLSGNMAKRGSRQQFAPQHEKAAHRVAQRTPRSARAAQLPARLINRRNSRMFADPATLRKAAGDHQFDIAGSKDLQHPRQQRFVMLKIGIHDGNEGCSGGEANPSTQADARPRRPMRFRQRTWGMRRATSSTRAAVPSGESSSTNRTSQSMPTRLAASRDTSASTFPASLKVGVTIDNSQASGASLSWPQSIARRSRAQSPAGVRRRVPLPRRPDT